MQSYTYYTQIRQADRDETGYWVEIPALPGCFSQGETYDEALANAEECIQAYLEALLKRGEPILKEFRLPSLVAIRVELPHAV